MGSGKSRVRGRKPQDQPILSVDDAMIAYKGEWVLMKVTDIDADKNPACGRIVAHSPSRSRITQAFGREPLRSLDPAAAEHQPYFVFKAYGSARSATNLDDILSRLAREGIEDVPHLW